MSVDSRDGRVRVRAAVSISILAHIHRQSCVRLRDYLASIMLATFRAQACCRAIMLVGTPRSYLFIISRWWVFVQLVVLAVQIVGFCGRLWCVCVFMLVMPIMYRFGLNHWSRGMLICGCGGVLLVFIAMQEPQQTTTMLLFAVMVIMLLLAVVVTMLLLVVKETMLLLVIMGTWLLIVASRLGWKFLATSLIGNYFGYTETACCHNRHNSLIMTMLRVRLLARHGVRLLYVHGMRLRRCTFLIFITVQEAEDATTMFSIFFVAVIDSSVIMYPLLLYVRLLMMHGVRLRGCTFLVLVTVQEAEYATVFSVFLVAVVDVALIICSLLPCILILT